MIGQPDTRRLAGWVRGQAKDPIAAPPKSSTLGRSASGDAGENAASFPQGNLMGLRTQPGPAHAHSSIFLRTDPLCDRGATSARGPSSKSTSFRRELICSVELLIELRAKHCVAKPGPHGLITWTMTPSRSSHPCAAFMHHRGVR